MMNKESKKQYVEQMKEVFANNESVMVAHYEGLNVNQLDELRKLFRENGILFKVTNNLYFLVFIYLFFSFLIAILTAKLTLSPIKSLADKLTNKKPNDLNYINDDLPIELTPLIIAFAAFLATSPETIAELFVKPAPE